MLNSLRMNVNLGIWDKLTRLVIFLLFVAGLLAVALWYFPVIKRNERMRKYILSQEVQIQNQEELSKQLRVSIDALRHDPKAVERLGREWFGLAKPGEVVIRFEAPVTNSVVRP